MYWMKLINRNFFPSSIIPRFISRSYSSSENFVDERKSSSPIVVDRSPGQPRRIVLIETESEWNKIYPSFVDELVGFPVLGFDCEWPPTRLTSENRGRYADETDERIFDRRKLSKVTLFQMATRRGTAVLIRIDRLRTIPPSLRRLLCDPSYLKVGVEARFDAKMLRGDYADSFDEDESIRGALDVRFLLYPDIDRPDVKYRSRNKFLRMRSSLRSLAKDYLNMEDLSSKDLRITCSDWAAERLSEEQIRYAASDAQLSVDVFAELARYVGFRVDDDGDEEEWMNIYEYCRPHLDQSFGPGRFESREAFARESTDDDGGGDRSEFSVGGRQSKSTMEDDQHQCRSKSPSEDTERLHSPSMDDGRPKLSPMNNVSTDLSSMDQDRSESSFGGDSRSKLSDDRSMKQRKEVERSKSPMDFSLRDKT